MDTIEFKKRLQLISEGGMIGWGCHLTQEQVQEVRSEILKQISLQQAKILNDWDAYFTKVVAIRCGSSSFRHNSDK